MLSPPKQILIKLLLYKTTILSNATNDHFLYPEEMGNKHKATMHKKINVSLVLFTLLLLYNAKFVSKNWNSL